MGVTTCIEGRFEELSQAVDQPAVRRVERRQRAEGLAAVAVVEVDALLQLVGRRNDDERRPHGKDRRPLGEAGRKRSLLHLSTITRRLDGVQVAFADAKPWIQKRPARGWREQGVLTDAGTV